MDRYSFLCALAPAFSVGVSAFHWFRPLSPGSLKLLFRIISIGSLFPDSSSCIMQRCFIRLHIVPLSTPKQLKNTCNFKLLFHQSLNPARPAEPGRSLSVFRIPKTFRFGAL